MPDYSKGTVLAGDARLCVAGWLKNLVVYPPGHFRNPARFFFALFDGSGLNRGAVSEAPKGAARQTGI